MTQEDLYRMGQWFVHLYIRRNRKRKPKRIIIDADGTDDPTYGDQQLTFFHGYYDQYMYHPLLVYDADTGEMITAVLRAGNRHASYGIVSILKRIVGKLKAAFPMPRSSSEVTLGLRYRPYTSIANKRNLNM